MSKFNITKCQIWIQYTIMIELGMIAGMGIMFALLKGYTI